MADYAATVGWNPNLAADSGPEIIIDAISQDIASVRIYSSHWVDFLHLTRARGDWKPSTSPGTTEATNSSPSIERHRSGYARPQSDAAA